MSPVRPPVSTNRVMAYPDRQPATLYRNAYATSDDLKLLLGRAPDPRFAP
ncbi:hypothetical protein [Streptacidiphilus sp. P02-A3a]|nr:hypothetical protein [Streptacidiphilus sp. P02-A3a]QMU67271.1 hypothetical protein GXP74_02650 [Streptacidiphilus sp. P02-A3a]